MSAISSQLSLRSSLSSWQFNARVFHIMDSIYAIAFGLGLRTLVDAVSQNLKLTASLIGLWEGVITLHFLKKMPHSLDPYIAFGVRLFIDFLITENIERLVLVLIWTAFGMVLADVMPAIWDEVGLDRAWRHFRRDLYTIYDKIPTVAFFPPQRTIRFLSPREREREREREEETSIITPSIATSQNIPITVIPPLSSVPSESPNHHVPGFYPEYYSDTDTELGSISRSRPSPRTEVNDALGTTHYRLSTMPKLNGTYSVSDLDEDNQSSAVSSSSSDQRDIPDMEEEEQALIDGDIEEVLPEPATPKQKHIPMPPTPSDSAARWDIHRDVVENVLHAKPSRQELPDIPDSGETPDGWEKIQRRELDEDVPPKPPTPPTPPAKDRPVSGAPKTENRRESVPPSYASHLDDSEDMYFIPLPKQPTDVDVHANVNDNDNDNDFTKQQTGASDINMVNPWDVPTSSDTAAHAQADETIRQKEAAEAGRIRKEEEQRRQDAEKLQAQQAEEAHRKDKAERKKREEQDDALRKQKQYEAEQKRKADEAEQKQRAEQKRMADEAEQAEQRRRANEAEQKRKADEAEQKQRAEQKRKADEAEQKRKADEAEQKRMADEAGQRQRAEQKRLADEAERKRKDDDAEQKKMEDEKKAKDDEAKQQKKEEEMRDTTEKQGQDKAANHAQKETEAKLKSEPKEVAGDESPQENDADSKGLHAAKISATQHSETDNVHDSSTPSHEDLTEEESVVSTATTDPPPQVKVRLERMMILRAQMIEVEKRLDELEGEGLNENSPEMKAAEKSLRKFQRQAARRYQAGMLSFEFLRRVMVHKF
jgi:hypothetical protein